MEFFLSVQVKEQFESFELKPGVYYGQVKDEYDVDGYFFYKIIIKVEPEDRIDYTVVNLGDDRFSITVKNDIWFAEILPHNIKKIFAKRSGTEMIDEATFDEAYKIALDKISTF